MVAALSSHDAPVLVEVVRQLRKLVSPEVNPSRSNVEPVIAAGVVPRLVQFLAHDQSPQLRFEAEYALTNIESGLRGHPNVIVEKDAVPVLVQLLCSPSEDLREQAAWALSEIAGDSAQLRDLVLQHGAMRALLQAVVESSRLSLLRNAVWAVLRPRVARAHHTRTPALLVERQGAAGLCLLGPLPPLRWTRR
jgi:hypothetical protein